MMVPQNRLLFWVGGLLPFWALAALTPLAVALAAGFSILLILTALADMWLGRNLLQGVRVDLPALVRLTKGRDGLIGLRIKNESQRVRYLKLGLPLPPQLKAELEMIRQLPPEAPMSKIDWPCLALRRGRYFIHRIYLETGTPLGLWAIRRAQTAESEIRVYPNLFKEREGLTALFLNRGALGLHPQRQIGKGRDFEQLREYLPGDNYEDIHWKATAKRGRPVTKIYQIERTQEIYIIIDASRLSGRRSVPADGPDPSAEEEPDTTICERFVTSALIVGLAAQRQGDLFGLAVFSNKVTSFIRAKNGQTHYDACREALYTVQPQLVSPDFAEVFAFIGARLRKRALLLFLTNLDDPILAESFTQNIHHLSRRHLVLAGMIPPPSAKPLFDSPEVNNLSRVYQALGGHFLWAGLCETEKRLKEMNVDLTLLSNEKMSAELVSRYIGIKQRQAL